MFIYLSKKIAIPNNSRLKCLAWNREQGYIACGGEDGLLKVLRLETGKDTKVKGLAAPSNLSMNQTLEGHNGGIRCITWNEQHQKLTSSDAHGLIIVWMLYKGSWYEEMINNRNKSVVKGMAWNSDGQKICIVYEDGAVIVGSVDGNRIWGKELKGVHLAGVGWSPDSRLLLFSLDNGEVHVYDNKGSFISKIGISASGNLVGVHWYNGKFGHQEPDCPSLAICYGNGRIYIMRHENDDVPVVLDCQMAVVSCNWNHNGSVLAVAGVSSSVADKECNVVQFYSPHGEHLRTLRVPGRNISMCAWEGGSLRIALAVDSFIYFANIRPSYKWCYFADTVVYTYTKAERPETLVVFWNVKNDERNVKAVHSLVCIASRGEHCVLATRTDDGSGTFGLLLCNAIGTVVDSKYVELEPVGVSMTLSVVVVASREAFYLWQYATPRSRSQLQSSRHHSERVYHVDGNPSATTRTVSNEMDKAYEPTTDPICCLAVSDSVLVIGRQSGVMQRYALPHVTLTNKYRANQRPHRLSLNSNSSRLAIIDVTGVLTFLDLDSRGGDVRGQEVSGDFLKFERKDVWDMCWAQDNPELFAMMEKTRLYIFRNLDPEEPVLSSGYICSFQDLEIQAVLLDEVLREPEKPNPDWVLHLEVKSLRDTRELLQKVGLKEAAQFIEENPHPRLWRQLADAAQNSLELTTAEAALVRCKDYSGLQLVKRLHNINNDTLRKAEVAAYRGDFDTAERLYLEMDRRDLAVQLRRKLGDDFQVVRLLKEGGGMAGDDVQKEEAASNIGDYFADRHQWEDAQKYYTMGHNQEKLVQCYHMLEDYTALETLANSLPENDPLLPSIAEMFETVGMCDQAVNAYVKCGQVKEALDCCVSLSQWRQAVQLARQHQVQKTGTLLARYAEHLLEKGKTLQAIELYRKAGRRLEAAALLVKLAETEGKKRSNPLRVKKLYVLAALLVEQHQDGLKTSTASGSRSSALMGIGDEFPLALMDSPWRGAEAYHFFILAQRELYEGYVDAAMKTALYLREFEDYLPEEDIYCLLALSATANRSFHTASTAFIKLEALKEDEEGDNQYEQLAMDIFIKCTPKDSRANRIECYNCESMVPDWVAACGECGTRFARCLVTGRPLNNPEVAWNCPTCKHAAGEQDMKLRTSCPLCHSRISA